MKTTPWEIFKKYSFYKLPLKVYICAFQQITQTMTTLNELNAISIDGRYRSKTFQLHFFSEVFNQIPRTGWNWIFHCFVRSALPQLAGVNLIYLKFTQIFYWRCTLIKETEKVTNHDKKSRILYQRCFWKLGLSQYKEFIHLGWSRHQ
jgi:hypothetical protein